MSKGRGRYSALSSRGARWQQLSARCCCCCCLAGAQAQAVASQVLQQLDPLCSPLSGLLAGSLEGGWEAALELVARVADALRAVSTHWHAWPACSQLLLLKLLPASLHAAQVWPLKLPCGWAFPQPRMQRLAGLVGGAFAAYVQARTCMADAARARTAARAATCTAAAAAAAAVPLTLHVLLCCTPSTGAAARFGPLAHGLPSAQGRPGIRQPAAGGLGLRGSDADV